MEGRQEGCRRIPCHALLGVSALARMLNGLPHAKSRLPHAYLGASLRPFALPALARRALGYCGDMCMLGCAHSNLSMCIVLVLCAYIRVRWVHRVCAARLFEMYSY